MLTSPSFPAGSQCNRTELEAREARSSRAHKNCPWCSTAPELARIINGVYLVGCENDYCDATPQVSDKTLTGAWAKWDARA